MITIISGLFTINFQYKNNNANVQIDDDDYDHNYNNYKLTKYCIIGDNGG